MRIRPFSGARRTFVRLRPQTGVFARVIYFRSVTLIKPMLFGMGFFIAIFIAIARCANRTGGPRVPLRVGLGCVVWLGQFENRDVSRRTFHSTEIFRNSFYSCRGRMPVEAKERQLPVATSPNLDDMKLPELKELAKQMGLRGVSTMRKTELIATLQAARSGGQAPAGVTVRAPKSAPPQTLRSNRQRTRRPMKPSRRNAPSVPSRPSPRNPPKSRMPWQRWTR